MTEKSQLLKMESAKLNDWLQILGMIGVIASLIFVGLELRQSREIAISQAYQLRAESEVAMIMEASSISAFQTGRPKLDAGLIEELTEEEQVALDYHYGALFTLWENDYFQYQQGYLSDEHWAKTEWNLTCTLGSRYIRLDEKRAEVLVLETGGWAMRESFADVARKIAKKAESDPYDCWDSD